MKEKHNFKIDLPNKSVLITVSPSIFPIPIILHAAYHFIDEAAVIVDGENEITVTFILDREVKESDLEDLACEFNTQLISSFVEDTESRKHAGARDAMLKAALNLPQIQPSIKRPSVEEPPIQKSTRQESKDKK